jgi:adenylosuccinate synthase
VSFLIEHRIDIHQSMNIIVDRLRSLYNYYKLTFPDLDVNIDKLLEQFKEMAEFFRPMTIDTIAYLNQTIVDGSKKILVEGANATMLDIDFGMIIVDKHIDRTNLILGTYPYVTSSNCSVGGVCTGLGLAPKYIGDIYGVVKAYTTRVGDGVFPTELKNVNIDCRFQIETCQLSRTLANIYKHVAVNGVLLPVENVDAVG